MPSLTGKERMQAVMRGEIPDRVPWGEYAIDYDTVERIIGHETFLRAKAESTFAFWEGRRDEVVQSWREDLIALYRKLDFLDIVNIGAMCTAAAPPRAERMIGFARQRTTNPCLRQASRAGNRFRRRRSERILAV